MPAGFVDQTELRARLASDLSRLYASEVPLYQTLVDVSREVNARVLIQDGAGVERLGSIERVTEERHGAIRVGTPKELRQVSRIFAAVGMHPVGFYDLRDTATDPIPVVATAFRPLDESELAANPFRVFTSMLTPDDRRFFDPELQHSLARFLDERELFPNEMLELADRSVADGGLEAADAAAFLGRACDSLALSPDPVDRRWYEQLAMVSSVAADIGASTTTHINHLTPRVLDIDALYAAMTDRGITMIDRIQGPPRWKGPSVLLRQTSFRALDEPRRFREPDGQTTQGTMRVRFGEVESRGVALTAKGRDLYDQMLAETDRESAEHPSVSRDTIAEQIWNRSMPSTEVELALADLAFYRYLVPTGAPHREDRPATASDLLRKGLVELQPIVYEDFLPRSAAGIFASNLAGATTADTDQSGQHIDAGRLSDVIGVQIIDPTLLYAQQRDASIELAAEQLRIDPAVLGGGQQQSVGNQPHRRGSTVWT